MNKKLAIALLVILTHTATAELYYPKRNKNENTGRYYRNNASDFHNNLFISGEFVTAPSVKASGDKSLVQDSKGYESSLPNFNISIGKYINQFYQPALSFGYREFSYKHQFTDPGGDLTNQAHKSKLYSLMLNNYFNLNVVPNMLSAYLLAGLGFNQMKPGNFTSTPLIGSSPVTDTTTAKNSTNLTYQAGLGAIFKCTDKLAFDTSARYASYGKMKFVDAKNISLKAIEIAIGLRVDL